MLFIPGIFLQMNTQTSSFRGAVPKRQLIILVLSCLIFIFLANAFLHVLHRGTKVTAKNYLAGLKDSNPEERRAAAWALSKVGNEDCLPYLEKCLEEDKDMATRRTAAWAIASIDAGRLKSFLRASDPVVRIITLQTYPRLGKRELIPEIIPLLEDKDPEVSQTAIGALRKFGGPEVIAALARLAGQSNREAGVRRPAIQALGEIGDVSVLETLNEISLRDADLRGDVNEATDKIKKRAAAI